MSVWDLWRQIDDREATKPKRQAPAGENLHASSSVMATAWLMKFAPERLSAWLNRHADGLERETLAALEPAAGRRRARA